jgi:DNA-binding transcriptional MerR regulator
MPPTFAARPARGENSLFAGVPMDYYSARCYGCAVSTEPPAATSPSGVPPPDVRAYTIDELAALTGVPSRTIRFYQAKGVLPPPRKHGRIAFYDDSHVSQLKVVADLQDKGLRLRAIRDLVRRSDLDADAIQKWLGIGHQVSNWAEDAPKLLNEEELKQLLGSPPPGTISQLIRRRAIIPQGDGLTRRYLVESPALIEIAMKLEAAGIDTDTAVGLYEILERRLRRAAEEVVAFAIDRVGRGFGRSDDPDDVMHAVETLFPGGAGGDAVRIIFAREVDRAVNQSLRQRPDRLRGRRHHRR